MYSLNAINIITDLFTNSFKFFCVKYCRKVKCLIKNVSTVGNMFNLKLKNLAFSSCSQMDKE